MQNKIYKGVISFILVLSVIFSYSFCFTAYAASETGVVTKDSVRIRTSPTTLADNRLTYNGANVLLNTGHTVTILDTVDSPDDENYKTWYYIEFSYKSVKLKGYIYSGFVEKKAIDSPGGVMPQGVPEIYKPYIQDLVDAHPDWKFVFYDTGFEWDNLFLESAQCYLQRSLVHSSYPVSYRSTQSGAYNWRTDKWISQDSGGWYQANEQTIAYYMDPRNFLNEENIFMFEALSYDETKQTISGVEKILDNSFMDGVNITNPEGKDVSYANAYIDAAVASQVSPYHLASRTIQEVGKKGSGSTSGTYSGYEGYYNFYNIGANSGSNPIALGLKYAKGDGVSDKNKAKYDLPWDSQYKAIVGGAKWIGTGYINNNQDTLYYQKFNVVNKVWSHQYMGNIMAPASESVNIRKTYIGLDMINEGFTFIIPYFRNMPDTACELPKASNANVNNWLKSLTIDGYNLEFDAAQTSGYSLTVPASTDYVNISAETVSSKASLTGTGKISLKDGSNTVKIVVTAENGNKRTYFLEIIRSTENKVPLKGISLNKTEITMFNGDVQELTVSYNPSNTTDSKNVTWTSSDKSVVTVDNGKITAIGRGTATVTAKVGTFSVTCKVTVNNKVIKGDIDADGAVTISDALMIFKYKSGEIKLSGNSLKAADTDENGIIELNDALRIYKYKSGELEEL